MFASFSLLLVLICAVPSANAAQTTALSEDELSATAPLTFEELSRFSRDWTDYIAWLDDTDDAPAYATVSETHDYSPATRKWIEKRDWTVDRFFYVEQHIRNALNYLAKVEKRDAYVAHIDTQIRNLEQSNFADKQKMIAQLRKTVERKEEYIPPVQPVTDDELLLIKTNRASLQALMNR